MSTISETSLIITTKVSAQEFVENLLGSAFATWWWWNIVKYDEGFDWDIFPADLDRPYLTLGIQIEGDETDEDGYPLLNTKKVCVNDLVRAYEALQNSGYRLDWENHDASSSDCVLQQAVFGKVIWG